MPQSYAPQGNPSTCAGTPYFVLSPTNRHTSITASGEWPEKRLAIILGTEGEGLCSETIRGCDYTVRIPMKPGVDSLNVAAASAVAFWELCK